MKFYFPRFDESNKYFFYKHLNYKIVVFQEKIINIDFYK